eukprot:COSAG02_NODE_308_length_25072_cov_20.906925_11_plen_132_part_00
MESLDLNDPTAVWISQPPMPTARRDLMVASTNTKIFVVGGQPSSGAPLDVLEIFDIETSTWSTGNPIPVPRTESSAGIIGSRLVVAGGYRTYSPYDEDDMVQIYDVESDTWTTGSPTLWPVTHPFVLLPIP